LKFTDEESENLINQIFPSGINESLLNELTAEGDKKTPFSPERFGSEFIDLGEAAFFEQLRAQVKNLRIRLKLEGIKKGVKRIKGKKPAKRLFPAFDSKGLVEVGKDWTSWIEFYKASGTAAIEPNIEVHLQDNIRKIAEEDERDRKVFEEL